MSQLKTATRSSATRRPVDRETLIQAALTLVGPHRSVSTLSLREVAREAGIAPNSFYRHFRDTDELAVALIDRAGTALRAIIGEARQEIARGNSVTRRSVEIFMAQLDADNHYLPLLLREGSVGSEAYKEAVERQLVFFEKELQTDLLRLADHPDQLRRPELVARAITRLVFSMGALSLDKEPEQRPQLIDDTVAMLRMILVGALQSAGS